MFIGHSTIIIFTVIIIVITTIIAKTSAYELHDMLQEQQVEISQTFTNQCNKRRKWKWMAKWGIIPSNRK